jgi:hypothetical protein
MGVERTGEEFEMGRERTGGRGRRARGCAAVQPADRPVEPRRSALRRILACALGAAAGAAATGASGQRARRRQHLPPAADLAIDAAAAAGRRVPILLFFDRDDCPYCERALREFLVPMADDPAWRDRAIFRQVEIDRATPLVDFAGASTTHRAFAARYRATLAPTVVVVDARGEPTGDPLVGLLTVDFYGAYLEDAVNAGLRKLRG